MPSQVPLLWLFFVEHNQFISAIWNDQGKRIRAREFYLTQSITEPVIDTTAEMASEDDSRAHSIERGSNRMRDRFWFAFFRQTGGTIPTNTETRIQRLSKSSWGASIEPDRGQRVIEASNILLERFQTFCQVGKSFEQVSLLENSSLSGIVYVFNFWRGSRDQWYAKVLPNKQIREVLANGWDGIGGRKVRRKELRVKNWE